tara:strand:+ start:105 stop:419 length:315 start_codon:yes stop_codon:yes gene_type:complete
MNIGQLDRRVKHQQYSTSQTAFGDKTKSWNAGTDYWAHAIFKDGKEKYIGNELKTVTTVIFTFRYNTNFTNKDRILFNSKYYYVTEILEQGRQKWTQLVTEQFE